MGDTWPKIGRLARRMLVDDAARPEPRGVTFADVRLVAETRGLLTGEEPGRTLSHGVNVMRAAGGRVVGYRTSRHRKRKGARVAVYSLA